MMKTYTSALVAVLALLVVLGCHTVAPKVNRAKQASFDPIADPKGNNQNSGALEFVNHELVASPNLRARYRALVAKYGGRFVPPLATNDDLVAVSPALMTKYGTTNLWLMTKDQLDHMALMTTWADNPPPAPKPP